MNSSKRVFCVVPFLLFLFPASSLSQENKSANDNRDNSLRQGAWAIQFQISNDFTLSSFQGAVISLKRHHSDRSAIRLGLSLDIGLEDGDGTNQGFEYDTLTTTIRHESSDREYVQIDLQYLRYPNPENAINLFLGFGPLFRFSRSYESRDFKYEGGDHWNITSRETTWALGLSGLAGVEWFILRYMSIHAEYAIEATYSRETFYFFDSYDDKRVGNSDGGNFKSRRLLFGLSAYF